MEVSKVVEMLQAIKIQYPSLTNREIIEVMKIKIMLENRARGL